MTRMNWRKAHLHGKPILDFRRESEIDDRAARWLRRHENSPAAVRRRTLAIAQQLGESSNWVTANSSEVPG
jgi:hypothetical protein